MLRKLTESPVLLSILMIVFGIILVVWPNPVLSIALQLLGIALMIGGAISVIDWFRHRTNRWIDYTHLGGGLVAIVGGIVVLSNPLGIASIFPTLIGIIILVSGIINMVKALDLKKMGYRRWNISFVFALITVVVGLIFISQPMTALAIPLIAAGIMLIYDGAVSLWIATRRL